MNTIALAPAIARKQDEGISASQILKPKSEFSDLETGALIDMIISEYHESARENAISIYKLVQKEMARPGRHQSAFAKLAEELFLFYDDLLYHMKKEEEILFPNILQLTEKREKQGPGNYSAFGIIRNCVVAMEKEHAEISRHFDQLREITMSYGLPESGSKSQQKLFEKMISFENDMLLHLQIENHFLFPKAIALDNN